MIRSTLALAALLFVALPSSSSARRYDFLNPGPNNASPLSVPSTEFALSLYDAIKAETAPTENIFFSPISISTVLSMTLLGAGGKTAEEISTALRYPSNFSHSQLGELTAGLVDKNDDDVVLLIANKIFTRDGLNFLRNFTSELKAHYLAEARPLDFGGDPDGSRLLINRWVEDKTKTNIKDLLPDGSVDSDTAAVLVNAVYFKGDWLNQFDRALTEPGYFKASPTLAFRRYRVDFMHAEETFPYGENSDLGFQVLHLPYKGEELSMVVLLPFADYGLAALEERLDADLLLKAVRETRYTDVEVTFPKFKIEESIDLTEKLGSVGIVELFSDRADLSGITEDVPLKVSKGLHKALIEVNEEGAEAAAASAVSFGFKSAYRPPPPPLFIADHPFLFGIFEKNTQLFLFLGRVARPTEVGRRRT